MFLCHAAGAVSGISFAALIEPMLWTFMHEEQNVREQSEECYVKLLQDPQCLRTLCTVLQQQDTEKHQVVLTVFLRFLAAAARDQILSMIPPVMRSAQKLLQSAVTAVRRLVVLVLVEFKSRASVEFNPHFRELSPQQQRLIDTYLTKRGD
jgi:hypothetical protein